MSAVEILLGATEPIGIRLRRGPTLVTGATVRARVLRSSDGKEYDWSTSTFVTSGTAVQPRQTLTETPASSGLYEYAWNTGAITNPTTPDTYLVEFDQTAPTARAFLRQCEVRVRAAQSISAAVAALPTAAANAAAVWGTAVPGAFSAGQAGYVLGTNLNATVSSRAVPGDAMALTTGERASTATAVWVSGTRTLTVGAITSATFAANALGAVWDELVVSHAAAGSFGLLVGTDLDAAVSTRATNAGAASAVWASPVPGAFASGSAGYVLGNNLNAAVSSRAVPGDAMTLTAGERSAVGAAVWATGTRTVTGTASGAITAASFAAGAIDASALAASAVAAVQAGLATSSALAGVQADADDIQARLPAALVGGRIDASVGAMGANTLTASAVASGAITAAKIAAGAITSSSFAAGALGAVWDELAAGHVLGGSFGLLVGTNLDAAVSSRLASAAYTSPPSASSVASQVWATVVPGAFSAGQAGYVLGTYVDAAVSTRSTPAQVAASESAIRGAQSLDLSLLGGASYNTAVDSLAAAAADRAVFLQALGDVQNSTTFSATIPILLRPQAGTTAYVVIVNIENTSGVPTDPDADTVTVAVQNGSGSDRSSNLSSTTMTRVGVGRYVVSYNLSSAAALEQLIFTFSYTQSAVPYAKDRTSTVVDTASSDFTASDRANLGAILADTSAMEPLVTANLDQSVSSAVAAVEAHGDLAWATAAGFAVPGDAMALTPAERTSVAGSVWSSGARTLTAGVSVAASGIDAASLTAGAVAAIQSGLATTANVGAVPAAVWATPEGAGSMGASLALLRRRTTNRRRLAADGTVTFYDDAGLPERTALLTDVLGGPIVVIPGDPADSTAET